MPPEPPPREGRWTRWNEGIVSANLEVVKEFRETGGHPGGYFAGAPMLLLHHVGARTAARRITPLVYVRDGLDMVVAASKGGAPRNPSWYHNLIAHPDASVQVEDTQFAVRAVEIFGLERDRLYEELALSRPAFAGYARATSRVIPMMRLHPLENGG